MAEGEATFPQSVYELPESGMVVWGLSTPHPPSTRHLTGPWEVACVPLRQN